MITEALNEYAKVVAEKDFFGDRSKTVGASEIGLCERKIYYVKKEPGVAEPGEETKPEEAEAIEHGTFISSWGGHVRGTVMEEAFWVPAMRKKYGDKLILAGKDQMTFTQGQLSATPDGLLRNLPRDCLSHLGVPDIGPSCSVVVECKTVDPRLNLDKKKYANSFQVMQSMGLIRRATVHRPDYAIVSYIDASFWSDVDEMVVKYDDEIYQVAEARAAKILGASGASELKPEGWIADGYECEYCPFTRPCGITRRSVPEREAAADPQFVAEVTDMCRSIQEAQKSGEDLEKQVKTRQDELKNRLREKGVRRVPGVVTWSSVKGRRTLQQTALKEAAQLAGIDVSEYEKTGDPTDQLRILL
jgi:hypothetical protein